MRMPIDIFGRSSVNNNSKAQARQIIDLSQFLKHDGTTEMTGNLDMENQSIKNLPMPEDFDDAASKAYVVLELEIHRNELKGYIDRELSKKWIQVGTVELEDLNNN